MKLALKAVSHIAHINPRRAEKSVRLGALFDEEIHIDEELINLEEAFSSYRAAGDTLKKYPKMQRRMLHEQREILEHSIGLLARMMQGKRLPRAYTKGDTMMALTRLTRLLVNEALRVGQKLDEDAVEIVRPFLTMRQRVALREWGEFEPKLQIELFKYKLSSIRQLN